MNVGRIAFARRLVAIVGLLAGALIGAATFVVAGSAVARNGTVSTSAFVDAVHVPPLLTVEGEPVDLMYEAYCVAPEAEEADAPCDLTGSVFIRSGASGPFRELALLRDGTASRLVARVPEVIASSRAGFTYYAEIEAGSGATVTLPAGGASAPHQSLPLGRTIEIDLGRHRFGEPLRADERVAEVGWGDRPNEAGLEQGWNLTPIGASAFDVDRSGVIVLLDQAHRRVLRWRAGSGTPAPVPVGIIGTLADMSLAPDGTIYVLESVSPPGGRPLVRHFDSQGRELVSTEIAERTSSQIRQGPNGPVVLQQPSGQWMPIAFGGSPVGPEVQSRRGRSGRPLSGGGEVIVLRRGNELRVALAGPAGVQSSWRVTSETAVGEIQLAEPSGKHLVLVVRVFTDSQDEFVVLVLGSERLVRKFSLDPADWAETAPLGRFRLVGPSLYQLGSTSAGAFVDRFDLEVR